MSASYPELDTDFARISQVAYGEEEAFRRTLQAGTQIFDVAVSQAKASDSHVLKGEDAFALHDTYGFPIDLTLEMAAEQGVQVDEEAFRRLMKEQRERARADALAKRTGRADTAAYDQLLSQLAGPTQFLGYTDSTSTSEVVGILVDGVPAPAATAPAEIEVVLDRTPFYAEAGGQLADTGTIQLQGGGLIEVDDVQAPVKGLSVHRGRLVDGTVVLGEQGTAQIDVQRRGAIARAHTATHMLHKALHESVGTTATQAGSENAPSHVRFDFRHGAALPAGALSEIEARINERLVEDLEVTDQITDLDTALSMGAMALFGAKYGNKVRMVSIGGDWSRELCAGTHVERSGALGLVKLLGESSIGSGVRRVDALVGAGAYEAQAKERALVHQLSGLLDSRPEELPERVSSLVSRLKETEKQLAALNQARLLSQAGQVADSATRTAGGTRLVRHDAGEVASADDLRALALEVRSRLGEEAAVVAVGGRSGGRALVVVATNAAARENGVRAGQLVRTASQVLGGGGGGKDDLAQGGGTDPSRLAEAFDALASGVA